MARNRSAKSEALDLITKMPTKATWDDIMYEIYARQKIAAGIAAADDGRVVTHDEVKRRFLRRR